MRLNYLIGSKFLHSMSHIYTHTKLRKHEQVIKSQRFSGKSRCQLQRSRRWSSYWTKEFVRRPGGKNTLIIWSSGRIIQLKMPDERLKQRYRIMDIPCRSSWTGAHESFQAREYDVGASPTSSAPARKTMDSWKAPDQIFLKFPWIYAPS
jgi:hypothetical protein